MTPRQYTSAKALRTALEARLLERAKRDNTDLQRLRRQVAFDRLLARLFSTDAAVRGWILKGGYALELRFRQARTTRDLDLTITSGGINARSVPSAQLRNHLVRSALIRLPDLFVFEVGDASLELDQAPEGGARFPVDARLDGRSFVKFHVDLGVGDAVLEPIDEIAGEDWLGFAGIARSAVPTLSLDQHWAEKLHTYSRPREGRTNTRVKDLVDLVLLIEQGTPVARSGANIGRGDVRAAPHTRRPAGTAASASGLEQAVLRAGRCPGFSRRSFTASRNQGPGTITFVVRTMPLR